VIKRIVNSLTWWLLAIWVAGFVTFSHQSRPLNAPITLGDLIQWAVAVVLVVSVAKFTAHVAARKGYSYTGWSYYGLFLNVFALIHASFKKPKQPPEPRPGVTVR
jgi:hypothetical protein